MANSFDRFQTLLKESVAPAVLDLTLPEDDVAWSLMDTFQPHYKAGRDTSNALGSADSGYYCEWRVLQQRGGSVEGANFGGGTSTTVGLDSSNPLNVGAGAQDLYPDPTLTSRRSWLNARMALKRLRGQLVLDKEDILAQIAADPLEDLAADHVEDAVYMVRKMITAMWWADGTGAVARFDGVPLTLGEATTNAYTVKDGTCYRFVKGQKYIAVQYIAAASRGSTAATVRTGTVNGVFYCTDIDTDTRQVFFNTAAGNGNIAGLDDGDWIIPYNMIDTTAANFTAGLRAPQGIESLMIDSGTFPGTTLDVTQHRELKGYVKGDEASPEAPTPERIAELIDLITDSGKMPPEVLIAERSLWTYYGQLERVAGANYPVPQGGSFHPSGGVTGPQFGHMENTFTHLHSSQIRPGMVAGLRPSTWKKFMPAGDKTIKWFSEGGGLSGVSGIFLPTISGSQYSSLTQAPFDVYCEFGLCDPRENFLRKGFDSYRSANGS